LPFDIPDDALVQPWPRSGPATARLGVDQLTLTTGGIVQVPSLSFGQ
jgi:hypothetical protein